VARRPPQFTWFVFAECGIHLFQRAEEATKAVLKMLRAATGLRKVAVAELPGCRDNGRAHHPVFVRTLRPGEAIRSVQPDSKTHGFNFG